MHLRHEAEMPEHALKDPALSHGRHQKRSVPQVREERAIGPPAQQRRAYARGWRRCQLSYSAALVCGKSSMPFIHRSFWLSMLTKVGDIQTPFYAAEDYPGKYGCFYDLNCKAIEFQKSLKKD